MVHTLIEKMCFKVHERPKNKIVQILLKLKADNIFPGRSWVMTDGIRVAPRVFLSDGRTNLIENAESLRMVYITP